MKAISATILALLVTLGLVWLARGSGNKSEPLVSNDGAYQKSSGSQGTTLRVCADPWLPYTGTAGTDQEGYMVDVLRAIFEPQGISVEYVNLPWTRCLKEVESGSMNAALGASVPEAPTFVYPRVIFGVSNNRYFALKDSTWRYTGEASLEEICIGMCADYSYGGALENLLAKYGDDPKHVFVSRGDDPCARLIHALAGRRVDAFIMNEHVMRYHAAIAGFELEVFRSVSDIVGTADVHAAFSPNLTSSKTYAETFSVGLDALREKNQLPAILQKYHLEDWKSP